MTDEYTPDLGATIADLHAAGKTISDISETQGMPSRKTILLWLSEYPAFELMMAQAKGAYVDALAEECLKIADEREDDYEKKAGKLGGEFFEFDPKAVQRDRLKIDTRLKLIEKWAPERYGRKKPGAGGETTIAAAAAGAAPVMSDNELVRRILFGIDRANRGAALPAHAVALSVPEVNEKPKRKRG